MIERNQSASEHLTERERTSSVAIVATRIQLSGDSTLAQLGDAENHHYQRRGPSELRC